MIAARMERKPDFNRLKKVLLRDGEPDILPIFEYFVDEEIIVAMIHQSPDYAGITKFYSEMGYDYLYTAARFNYDFIKTSTCDTAMLSHNQRAFTENNSGIIENRKDFDKYPWPVIDEAVAYNVMQTQKLLPDGMKMIVDLVPGGILECVMWLMGYIPFSYALYEDEQLIWDLFQKVTENILKITDYCIKESSAGSIGAIAYGDDMGFKHSTLISPEMLKKYVFPNQKKVVELAHHYDLPIILHSCGKVDDVMDEIIDYVGFDAKHSFEDQIMPITEAKEKYGKRIALLGGIDMDVLCRSEESVLRAYIRNIIQRCAPGGGFAIGSGNSIANYVPAKNYLILLDECKKAGISA
jgi:uroporphyrinogen decarboxylase